MSGARQAHLWVGGGVVSPPHDVESLSDIAAPRGACGALASCDEGTTCRAVKNPGDAAGGARECRFGLDGGFSSTSGTCVDPERVTGCGF